MEDSKYKAYYGKQQVIMDTTWIISATAGRLVTIFCTNIHEWQTFFKTEMHYSVMERKEQGLDEEKQTFPGCIHYHVGNVNTCIYVSVHTLISLRNPMLYNDTLSA